MIKKSPAPVFALTMFVSAACMFAVQPMAGKMLLPLIGGAPSGWIVALSFFQTMLLGGYFLAHALAALSPRAHALAFIAILLVGAAFLPFHMDGSVLTGAQDVSQPFAVFLLLAKALAIPFIAISATASTIQRLFTVTGGKDARDPYFLYAASNAGSLAGLLAYPLLIEPWFSLSVQTKAWTLFYTLLSLLTAACLFLARGKEAEKVKTKAAPVPWKTRLTWTALAFLPSSLLTGSTNLMMAEVISAPLIWVLPLALYLAVFIAAFSRKPPVSAATSEKMLPYAAAAAVAACLWQPPVANGGVVTLLLHMGAFTAAAMFCTLRLASLRPSAESHLTGFYLALAVGGALGGILNAFIAPHVFVRVIEYPLCMLAAGFFFKGCGFRTLSGRWLAALLGVVALVGLAPPEKMAFGAEYTALAPWFAGGLSVAAFFLADLRRAWVFPALALIFAAGEFLMPRDTLVMRARNFFGTVKVYEIAGKARYLLHGTTLHGIEPLGEKRAPLVAGTSYYTPVSFLIKTINPRRVAVIGLGAGTVNCYSAPNRTFTHIEIDPAIVDAALNAFSFLKDCKSAKPPRIIIGDGRLEMGRLEGETFDLILVDAFSSDAIPTHLLTKEALELYKSRLAKGGVIAMNITNRYFTLDQPLAATARAAGLDPWLLRHMNEDKTPFVFNSKWMFAGTADARLSRLKKYGAIPAEGPPEKTWTDDHTNVLSAMEF